ncbi:MAG: hypothetical protein JST00_05915 [Deltaproteobacteria bacterium]|nr:hypothetical protein [Deltaproteobacteria bacterium]
MKRVLKALHTFGAIGMMGGYLAFLVLIHAAERRPLAEGIVLRRAIETLFEALVIPSVAVTLVSGLLAMAAHRPFINAGWVWLKLATTVLALEGSFGMHSRARDVTKLYAEAAPGSEAARELASLAGREKGALATLLVIAGANVVLGVWRPKLRRVTTKVTKPTKTEPAATDGREDASEGEGPEAIEGAAKGTATEGDVAVEP